MTALTAKDIMNPEILAAHAHWTLDRLAGFLVENGISGAPVIGDDETLVGVVSLTDLVRDSSLHLHEISAAQTHDYYHYALQSQYAREEIAALRIQTEPLVTVHDIMTPLIFQVSENTPIQDVADTMIRGRIHRVFVTSRKKVVGIIAALDMLKIIRDS
jgi:CBS domain-containing protein